MNAGNSNQSKRHGELMGLDIAKTLNELREQCANDEDVFSINLTLGVLAKKVKDDESVKHIETVRQLLDTQYADPFVTLNDNRKKQLLNLCKYVEDIYSTLLIHTEEIDSDYSTSSISSAENNPVNHPIPETNGNSGESKCSVCQNVIDSSNISLVCRECGAHFCNTCEGWFREDRKRGQPPLCESCYKSEQERLERERKEMEEQERLRKQREEEERLRKEAEEREKKKLTNSIGMKFVKIPAGEFRMGSAEYDDEGPVHEVAIPEAFYLGKYPVTQKQWKAVMGNNPSYFKGDDRPVENVSWDDAQEFINRLNEKEGTDEYCLPSEAEWEYACRAGTTTSYSFGDGESKLREYAWYDDNSGGKSKPVGKKKPNPWGLYDMHGNVYEWCQDEWYDYYYGAPDDGSAWEDGTSPFRFSDRVIRGGGWYFGARGCRSATRGRNSPGISDYGLGFRLLRKI